MTTEKRDSLASQAAMFIPLATSELEAAERYIVEGKPQEALTAIREAQIYLGELTRLYEEACAEARGDAVG